MAFCGMLAKHTNDRDRLIRLWASSGLWREKSERADYQDATVERAMRDSGHLAAPRQAQRPRQRVPARRGARLRPGLLRGARLALVGRHALARRSARRGGGRAKDSAVRFQEAVKIMKDLGRGRGLEAPHGPTRPSPCPRPPCNNAVKLAQTERAIARELDQFDTAPHVLNLSNGTLDLRTGRLREHDRGDLLTLLAPRTSSRMPRADLWDGFVQRILPDPEVRRFVQRCAGYSLTGDPVEKVLLFAHGPSDTGKSTFLNALEAALGEYVQTADFETFLTRKGGHGIRNDLARMRGARLVKSVEVERGEKLAAGVIKALTGSDTIAARFLYREHFEFRMQAVLWLGANDRPQVDADDDAMWRRIVARPVRAGDPTGGAGQGSWRPAEGGRVPGGRARVDGRGLPGTGPRTGSRSRRPYRVRRGVQGGDEPAAGLDGRVRPGGRPGRLGDGQRRP